MKITKMTKNGQKLTCEEFNAFSVDLHAAMTSHGFITELNRINSTGATLGLWKCSFKIDVSKLGYNTQHSIGNNLRRTAFPSWDQRVTYNDTINSVMDAHGISAKVKNSVFTIREGLNAKTESDWENEKPEYMHHNESRGYYIEEGDYKAKAA